MPSEPTTKPESTSPHLLTVESSVDQDGTEFNLVILSVTDNETGLLVKEMADDIAPEIITLTGKELGEFPDTPEGLVEMRQKAMDHYKNKLLPLKDGIFNADLGVYVLFDAQGFNKVNSFSADRRKLKMIPMLDEIIRRGSKTLTMVSTPKAKRRGVVKAHILKTLIVLEGEQITARCVIHEKRDGTFSYDHAVDQEEYKKGVGRSRGAMDSVDATDHGLPVLLPDEPSSEHALDSSVAPSGMVFNLFIEGEEPEVVEEPELNRLTQPIRKLANYDEGTFNLIQSRRGFHLIEWRKQKHILHFVVKEKPDKTVVKVELNEPPENIFERFSSNRLVAVWNVKISALGTLVTTGSINTDTLVFIKDNGEIVPYTSFRDFKFKNLKYPAITPELAPVDAAPEIITLTGKELGEFPDTPEGLIALREKAIKEFKDNLQKLPKGVFNRALDKWVTFPRKSREKVESFSADRRKLKLVAALKSIVGDGSPTPVSPLTPHEAAAKSGVIKVHVLKTPVVFDGAEIVVRFLIYERADGSAFYDYSVDRSDVNKAMGGTTEALDTADAAALNRSALLPDEPSSEHRLDSSVALSGMVFNLFIEGEEPEAIEDMPADESTPPPVTESAPKEPWQMTIKEWLKTAAIMRGDTVAGLISHTGVVVPKYGDIKLPASVDRVPVYVTDLKNKRISDGKVLRGLHSRIVEETVRKGIAVPLEVLADYPWLLHPDGSQVKAFTLPYNFAHMTLEFKRWIANSVNETSRSLFATAKAMDEAAIRNGASIEWGVFNGATFDSIFVDDDGEEWDEDDFYNTADDDYNENGNDVFDSSDHWKQQPRNRRTGRWELRCGKRIKDAAKGALHALGRAASRANSYVSQALSKGGSKPAHSSSADLAAIGHAGAELDPGAAAIGELLGGIRSVTRVLDSVVFDAAYSPNVHGYVGRVLKDGELVGRINLGDDGKAMVYVGAEGNQQASKDGSRGSYLRGEDAAQLIDWLFAGLNDETAATKEIIAPKPVTANNVARLDSIYKFNATPQFKEWVADYLDAPAPNPFLTAKAMDEDAIWNGVSIDWGFFEGAIKNPSAGRSGSLFDAVEDEFDPFKREEEGIDIHGYKGMVIDDGVVIGRIDIDYEGAAMVFVGHASDQDADEGEEDTQVKRPNGLPIEEYSVEDAPKMVGWLVQQLATPHSVNTLGEKPLSYLMNGKGKAIIGKVVSDGVSFDIYAEGAGTFVEVGLENSDSIDNPAHSTLSYTSANEAVEKLLDEFDKNALFTLNDPNAVAPKTVAQNQDELPPESAPTKGRMGLDDVLRVATLPGRGGNTAFHVYRKVDDAEASKIKQATGVDVSGFEHGIDEAAIRHALNQHGNVETENARGQVAITQEDFKLIAGLTDPAQADSIESGEVSREGLETIVYKKRINGFIVVVEEVREGRNRLAFKTMWKIRSAPRGTSDEAAALPSETFGAQSPTGEPSLVQPSENDKPIGDGSPESVKFVNALSQSGDLNDPDVRAQLNVFSRGDLSVVNTSDSYTKATRILLEGSLKVPTPKNRHVRIVNKNVDKNANIAPQPIDKKVKQVASVADRLSAAMTLAGKDDVRLQLNGVLVQEGKLIATDRHRMIIHETDTSALIASHTVNNNGELIINRNGQAIEGVSKYPDYNRVIPEIKATDTVVVIDAKKLAARVRGVIKAAKFFFNQDAPVALEFGEVRAAYTLKYLLEMAESFLGLGYSEFTIYLKADAPNNALLAVSADSKVKQVLMPRSHIDDTNSNLFKPIGVEVVVNSEVAMPTEAAAPVANNGDEEMSFLQSVVTGNVDFYDKAVTDRLESLAKTVSDPEMTALIKQAKKAVKAFFNAEFKKKAN